MAAGPSSSSLEEINNRQGGGPGGRHPEMGPDLASWQEAQIAACIEDNTINMVLEQYLSFFEARHNGGVEEAEMMVQAQAAELEHEQEVENRAIMAAINERGLQAAAIEEDRAVEPVPDLVPVPAAMDVDQPGDLLESAVVAAIQEKGLQFGAGGGAMDEDDIDGS